jgi:hypothetical protein
VHPRARTVRRAEVGGASRLVGSYPIRA